MRFNKKGFDKAIEIFIFLFIIMVVGVVVLRMFKAQIADKTSNLAAITEEELDQQALRGARSLCTTLCEEAQAGDCLPQSVASYCGNNLGPMDLNGDGETNGYTDALGGGVGVCEDRIFCPLLMECKCNGAALDIAKCRIDLETFYTENTISSGTANSGAGRLTAGTSCTPVPTGYPPLWT